jgi:hypothetical protein
MEKRPFDQLGLSPDILKAVDKLGFEEASPDAVGGDSGGALWPGVMSSGSRHGLGQDGRVCDSGDRESGSRSAARCRC